MLGLNLNITIGIIIVMINDIGLSDLQRIGYLTYRPNARLLRSRNEITSHSKVFLIDAFGALSYWWIRHIPRWACSERTRLRHLVDCWHPHETIVPSATYEACDPCRNADMLRTTKSPVPCGIRDQQSHPLELRVAAAAPVIRRILMVPVPRCTLF